VKKPPANEKSVVEVSETGVAPKALNAAFSPEGPGAREK
jgi:hypothetical protein